jgi:hypothetical protein
MHKLNQLVEEIQKETKKKFDELLTEDVMKNITEDQKIAINLLENKIKIGNDIGATINDIQTILNKVHGI